MDKTNTSSGPSDSSWLLNTCTTPIAFKLPSHVFVSVMTEPWLNWIHYLWCYLMVISLLKWEENVDSNPLSSLSWFPACTLAALLRILLQMDQHKKKKLSQQENVSRQEGFLHIMPKIYVTKGKVIKDTFYCCERFTRDHTRAATFQNLISIQTDKTVTYQGNLSTV